MATFQPVVRGSRNDRLMVVFIRVTHRSKVAYLRTDKLVSARCVSAHGEIEDVSVNRYCYELIERFGEALNGVDYGGWSAIDMRNFLLSRMKGSVTFSEYCRGFIERKGKVSEGNAHVYEAALKSLTEYLGYEEVKFGDLNVSVLRGWIDSLEEHVRAQTLYPKCVKVMYDSAERMSRDPRNGIEELKDVWNGVMIPRYVSTRRLAVSVKACRDFFGYVLPEGGHGSALMRLGRDVAMMVLCLAGMNTVDLYGLRKRDYYDGILHYKRKKTSSRRSDGAYFEIKVPKVLEEVIERWKAPEESESLFVFAQRYGDAKVFNVSVNNGIKKLCQRLGTDVMYSAYTFRHTWATLAQNDVGASLSEIGFGMNHSLNSVTRGYIKIDFSPAWRLNEAVVALVFGGEVKREVKREPMVKDRTCCSRRIEISADHMVYARAYVRGEMVAETGDIGFVSADEVVRQLMGLLPPTVPEGATVLIRIKDVDTDCEAVVSAVRLQESFES